MLRCGRFSCTSTRDDDDGDDDHDDNHDVDVDIADDTKVSFLGLFNSPPRKCLKSDDSREPHRCPAPCFSQGGEWWQWDFRP